MNKASHSRNFTQTLGLAIGPFLAFAMIAFLEPPIEHPYMVKMAAVVTLMSVWWVTEAIPLAATSLIPMVLFPVFGISSGRQIAGSYMNSVIFLFIGGFLIALAMERWNLHRRIALSIIYRFGKNTMGLILGFMAASAFLSMWISNTATAVMMLPIALSLVHQMEDEFGKERVHPFSLTLLLGIAFGSSIGGAATLVGTPTNLAFVRIYSEMFPAATQVEFGQWFLVGLPIAVVTLLSSWWILTKYACKLESGLVIDRVVIRNEIRQLGKLRYEELVVLLIWIVTAILWIFRGDLSLGFITIRGWQAIWQGFSKVDDSTVALLMALLLFIIPSSKKSDGKAIIEVAAFRDLPWSAILLFGGGFALAVGFTETGLVDYLSNQFGRFGNLPPWISIVIACVVVAVVTEFVSNIAAVQMFVPVVAALALAQDVHPLLLMVPVTFTTSMAFMMPVATPPNAVIFGSERIRVVEMCRCGLWVKLPALLITVVFAQILVPVFFDLHG